MIVLPKQRVPLFQRRGFKRGVREAAAFLETFFACTEGVRRADLACCLARGQRVPDIPTAYELGRAAGYNLTLHVNAKNIMMDSEA
jgi:hypothetical protein